MADDMMEKADHHQRRPRRKLTEEERAKKTTDKKEHERIRNLQNQADETAFILARNIGLMDERRKGLEELEQRSEALETSARQFHLTSSMVKFKYKHWFTVQLCGPCIKCFHAARYSCEVCRTKCMNNLRRKLGKTEKPIPVAPLYYVNDSDVEAENATKPEAPAPTMEDATED
ncbi:hypothetical protein Ciccas_004564 [Cichlidogyrus casuarinus]|uniref:V-SNARE coiled-coil homology domain-containing protein n=1 Tax=Cichlidogyrus casuarinus TaxID=1844966 RepID=A0ABD2QB60_9PLAT